MLITFKTRANYPNITMFGDVALRLIRLMGRRDTVPSAIEADDIPTAISSLRRGVAVEDAKEEEQHPARGNEDEDPPVSLHNRAVPLIELLETAHGEGLPVMWEEGGSFY
jgi:hypothetical protein